MSKRTIRNARICSKCARELGAKMDNEVATMSEEKCARCGELKYTLSMVKWGLYDISINGKKARV